MRRRHLADVILATHICLPFFRYARHSDLSSSSTSLTF